MLPFHLIYSDGYDLNLGRHVFPSEKYRLIRDQLLADGVAGPSDFLEPQPATDDQLRLVHTPVWIDKLNTGTLTQAEEQRLEIPYSDQMRKAFWLAAGGSILAGRRALQERIGFNIGGGFHHAFPAHGEGFCAIHDVAVAIRVLQQEGHIQRGMVVDCDVHHGNGTAAVFQGDKTVFTLSIHQFNNYPSQKPRSSVDIDLPDGVGDREYGRLLGDALSHALDSFRPDLLFYIAGADPYRDDQLGGLSLTLEGLQARDVLVFDSAINRKIPIAVALAGGYARRIADTVRIHCNTVRAASQIMEQPVLSA